MQPQITAVKWSKTYRLINSCYPPCDIWEDIISNHEDWKTAFEIECMTNPRVRQELGDISLVDPKRIVTGTNSWWVISAFTHFNPLGDRFTDGTFGAYYAANNFTTAVKEKSFGLTKRFMSSTNEEIDDITCRVLVGSIDSTLHDIRDAKKWSKYYNRDSYTESQLLSKKLRNNNSNGIVYKSVRDDDGECFAAFWPDVVSIPIQERHVILHWDGKDIVSFFEIRENNKTRVEI